MTARQIDIRIKGLAKLEEERKALDEKIEAIKDAIKEEMGDREEVTTGKYIIKWTMYIRNQFDSKGFKADHKGLFEKYSKPVEGRRFSYKEV